MTDVALVTGGAGFIGSHVTEELVKHGYKVRVLDSLIKGRRASIQPLLDSGAVEFIEGDIRSRDIVDHAMTGVRFVFHTAGVHILRSMASPDECIEVNVRGSYNIFRSALDSGVERVIFSSSSSVYGNPETLPMSEDSPLKPVEPYGASKLMCEHLLQFLATKGLKYNALRYFNVYGARQAVHAYYTTVIIQFIRNILNGQPPLIDGAGTQSMDFTHVSDVARANVAAAESTAVNEFFNVGLGTSTTVAELVRILAEALGMNVKPIFSGRPSLVSRRQADPRKARELLGFECEVLPREGLSQVAREIADHPELY